MDIQGKVHCMFEQSGTFKNQFIKLGIPAEDYDIQNHYGQTDHVVDLFAEIEKGYDGKPSIWDDIDPDKDLVLAFFPCIYFCNISMLAHTFDYLNYKEQNFDKRQMCEAIIERSRKRQRYYELCVEMHCIAHTRGIRLIMENPWTMPHFLYNNFPTPPRLIDVNRRRRGDYFIKPTAYWFVNCEPTHGLSYQKPAYNATVYGVKSKAPKAGVCDEVRSTISPDYARNFICDFLIGRKQSYTQSDIFQ